MVRSIGPKAIFEECLYTQMANFAFTTQNKLRNTTESTFTQNRNSSSFFQFLVNFYSKTMEKLKGYLIELDAMLTGIYLRLRCAEMKESE